MTDQQPLLTERIAQYFRAEGIEDHQFQAEDDGYCILVIRHLDSYHFQPHWVMQDILTIADEYRACEAVIKKYAREHDCGIQLGLAPNRMTLHVSGYNIKSEGDLEALVKIREEAMQLPKVRD